MFRSLLRKKLNFCDFTKLAVQTEFKVFQQTVKRNHSVSQKKVVSLKDHLHNKISTTGPISVAEFMKSVLTNPHSGYYMDKDVLGPEGDFVTSPELSQMFGELIAIWIVNEWQACSKPAKFKIVELGPGRGTLCQDILRTFKQLARSLEGSKFSLHLVEVSPSLSQIQYENLIGNQNDSLSKEKRQDKHYLSGFTSDNVPIYWHETIDDVTEGECTFFVAHEFFDALPVHKFIKADGKWNEVFVDIDKEDTNLKFRFVMMKHSTPASKMLIKTHEKRNQIEISPETAIITQQIAKRISTHNGAALLADYGHFGTKEDTLRAFKQHAMIDVLSDIGHCDITADVDFKYIHDSLTDFDVDICGPVTQQTFLRNMGIDTRLMMLLRSTTDPELRRKLIGSYDVMTNPEKMGERFKFLALTSKSRIRSEQFSNVTGFT